MRFWIVIFALVASSHLGAISLDRLIEHALKDSPKLQQARIAQAIAKAKRAQKESERLGQFSVVGSYTRYNQPRTLAPLTPSALSTPGSAGGIATTKDLFTTGINYRVALFTGGAQTSQIEISRIAEESARIAFALSKSELIYNLKTLYLSALSLQEAIEAQRAYKRTLASLLRSTKKAIQVGKKAPIDALKIENQIAQIDAKIVADQAQIDAIKASIKALSGVNVNRFKKVAVTLDPKALRNASHIDISTLYKARKEELSVQQALKRLKQANAQRYPQLFLEGYSGYNYGPNDGANPNPDTWNSEPIWQVGVSLRWSLFDFGATQARIEQSKLAILSAQSKHRQHLRDIQKQIDQAFAKLKESLGAYKAASNALRLAQKSESIERVRYRNDLASINDVLLAHTQTLQAKSALIGAKYRWQSYRYLLEYLTEKGITE